MGKIFTALGLMSGTSGDGVDASIISSDGITQYKEILNHYREFRGDLRQELINLRSLIFSN